MRKQNEEDETDIITLCEKGECGHVILSDQNKKDIALYWKLKRYPEMFPMKLTNIRRDDLYEKFLIIDEAMSIIDSVKEKIKYGS